MTDSKEPWTIEALSKLSFDELWKLPEKEILNTEVLVQFFKGAMVPFTPSRFYETGNSWDHVCLGAAIHGFDALLKFAISKGDEISADTLSRMAAKVEHKVLVMCRDVCAKPDFETMLQFAVRGGRKENVVQAIAWGAKDFTTALTVATETLNNDMIRMLAIEYKAQVTDMAFFQAYCVMSRSEDRKTTLKLLKELGGSDLALLMKCAKGDDEWRKWIVSELL